jgi:hypothetical protein
MLPPRSNCRLCSRGTGLNGLARAFDPCQATELNRSAHGVGMRPYNRDRIGSTVGQGSSSRSVIEGYHSRRVGPRPAR